MDDCNMLVKKDYPIQTIFPGIPPGVSSVFRYTDGNLYFVVKQQLYRYNEFAQAITAAGRFDLGIIGITYPRNG